MKKYKLIKSFPGFLKGEYLWVNQIGSHAKEFYDSPHMSSESHVFTWHSGTMPEFDNYFIEVI